MPVLELPCIRPKRSQGMKTQRHFLFEGNPGRVKQDSSGRDDPRSLTVLVETSCLTNGPDGMRIPKAILAWLKASLGT